MKEYKVYVIKQLFSYEIIQTYETYNDSNKCLLYIKRNSKTPKGQTETVKYEYRQVLGQQNETKDKHRTCHSTLNIKAGVT